MNIFSSKEILILSSIYYVLMISTIWTVIFVTNIKSEPINVQLFGKGEFREISKEKIKLNMISLLVIKLVG